MAGKRKVAVCSNPGKDQDHHLENQNSKAMDTFTPELPDLFVCQVLLLLSTKLAVRFSTLSKQWERVWSSVQVLDFDEYEQTHGDGDDKHRRRMFPKFLRACLKRRKKHKHDLDKLRLYMRYSGTAKIIDKWSEFAVERNVKELDIILTSRRKRGVGGNYILLQTVLSAKSLTTLNLKNVKIEGNNISPMSLPSLKAMSLQNMDLGEGNLAFVHLISGCPSIEYLAIISCMLREVKVSSSSLKSLEVTRCAGISERRRSCSIMRFKVEAMNLESFRLYNVYTCDMRNGDVDILSCRKIRNLEIFSAWFDDEWFEGLNSRFPILENLVLQNCMNYQLDTMSNIDSQHLKRFELVGTSNRIYLATINAPNLVSFLYSNESSPDFGLPDLLTKFSLTAPSLLEATITFVCSFAAKDFPLISFLGEFDCSRKLSLSVKNTEALYFPRGMRRTHCSPLPSLHHLKVVIVNSAAAARDLVLRDSLQWTAPNLQSLHINETEIFTDGW